MSRMPQRTGVWVLRQMYLFDNVIKIIQKPWPHLVIENALPSDVALYMYKHFPPVGVSVGEILNNQRREDYIDDEVYRKFTLENRSRAAETFELLDEAFGDFSTDQYRLSNFTFRDEPPAWPRVELRPWHIDKPTKKYHMMYYLGTGAGGELEMLDEETGDVQQYAYEHNRLIVWKNADYTFHRFFSSDVQRRTISLGVEHF